jgi:DNA-binding response OmpR family regulator
MRLLIIEDERELAKSIAKYLSKENYIIDIANNFKEADQKVGDNEYDCALVDLMLPDGNGMDIVKVIKEEQPVCGIIIITAKDTLDDKVLGLEIGADDYITKPFHLAELNARLKSLIRRRNFSGSDEIKFSDLTIDIDKREVKVYGKLVDLTKREYDILLFFISNKERVVTKETIVEHVWGDDSSIFDNFDFVYTHIKNLRKKLIENGAKDYINSVYGIGYKFSVK